MIKTVIKPPVTAFSSGLLIIKNIEEWLCNTFGSNVPKRRKIWSVSWNYINRTITIMCRYPEQALLIRLRWA